MDSKIKTGLSQGSLRVPKLSRSITSRSEPNSPSPSRKVPTPPEKTRTRSVIGSSSEPQPRLSQIKEDLRKANEMIASLELEKAKALDELEQVREEAFEKLYEVFEAQKMAKENFEIEKFKAVEAGVEAAQELKKELEIVKNQHASDSALLLLVTRELEKVTQELAAANEAKSKLLIQAEKVDTLSSELKRLKSMLDSIREKETISNKEMVVLRSELEKARGFEAEVKKRGRIIEKLNGELEVLTMEKSLAHATAEKWRNRARDLEQQLEKSLKQLQGSKESLSKVEKELEVVKQREQDANSSVQVLLTGRRKVSLELEKNKKAMESLACEAREMKEKLVSLGSQDYETYVEDLKLVIQETNEKYEKMVHEVEQSKKQFESSRVDWEMREAGLVNHVKKCDEEVYSMGKEIDRLGNLVKKTKEEADGALKKEAEMRDDLKEVEDEVSYLQETLRESRAESLKLNAKMLDKETEFQGVLHENDLLRVKQDGSLEKIKELSKLLEEALVEKDTEEEDQDYDLLPKVVEFEDSSDGNDDDDTVEVEYSMLESYHTEKKETSL